MKKEEQKFRVVLNAYDGGTIHLKQKFNSKKEAEKFVNSAGENLEEIASIIPILKNSIWINYERGYVCEESIRKEINEKK